MHYSKLAGAALLCALAMPAMAQVDTARGGPISTLSLNPKPVSYSHQAITRNSAPTYTYRYFDDLYTVQTASAANLALVPDPAGSGRQVFRTTVLKSDAKAANGSRTEVTLKYEYIIEGLRWYAVSVYLPKDWVIDPNPTVLSQLHTSQKTVTVAPPVMLIASGNDLQLSLHYNHRGTSATATNPATNANSGVQTIRVAKLETGRWYCMVMRADWSYKPGVGSFTAWLNGSVVFDAKNSFNSYETWLGNYPKVGAYLPGTMFVDKRVVFADFIHLGGPASTYEMMAKLTPCGVTPQPVNM